MEFSGITYVGEKKKNQKLFDSLPTELKNFYEKVNGLIAFDGGLHIRGLVDTPDWHSLEYYWTGKGAFFCIYDEIKETDIPFAQDCLGDQFFIRGIRVFKLSTETGEIEDLEISFNEFIEKSIEDPVEFLMLQPLLQFQSGNGLLIPGQLLSAYPPFCTKESENGVDLKNIPVNDRLAFLAQFYNQIKNIEDNDSINIEIVN